MTKLSVTWNKVLNVIDIQQIDYLERLDRKTIIHAGKDSFKTARTLDSLAADLPGAFIRTHKSYMLNGHRVKELRRTEAILTDGARIPISRSRTEETRAQLLKMLKNT